MQIQRLRARAALLLFVAERSRRLVLARSRSRARSGLAHDFNELARHLPMPRSSGTTLAMKLRKTWSHPHGTPDRPELRDLRAQAHHPRGRRRARAARVA